MNELERQEDAMYRVPTNDHTPYALVALKRPGRVSPHARYPLHVAREVNSRR